MAAQGARAMRSMKKAPEVKAVLPRRWNIFVGDTVEVVDGRHDLGKQGEVLRMIPEKLQVIVKGVREVTRNVASQENSQGGTVMREQPVHYSNLALVDPVSKAPTKVKWMRDEQGKLVRIARASGSVVPVPQYWKKDKPTHPDGPLDTVEVDAFRTTYKPSLEPFEQSIMQKLDLQKLKNSTSSNKT